MERTWRKAPIVGLLAVLALIASACAPAQPSPGVDATPTTAQASAPGSYYRRSGPQGSGASGGPIVRIGAALSLSGSARMIGMAQRSGIKLAQDEINASHMLGNTRLE